MSDDAETLAWFDRAALPLAVVDADHNVPQLNRAALRLLGVESTTPGWALRPPQAALFEAANAEDPAADASQALLSIAVELGNVATWRHDFKTGIVKLDARTLAVLGFDPPDGQLSVAQLRALMHPDDWAPMTAASAEALRSNRPVDSVTRYQRAGGGWRNVLLRRTVQRGPDGKAVAFVGTAMDVTEQLERDRREQEMIERFDLVRRSVGFGTWYQAVDTGSSIWDDQMWALRGLPPQPGVVTAAQRDACVHIEDREALAAKIARSRESGKAFEHDFRIVRPDGEVRWLASRSLERRDPATGVRRRFGVNWDMTASHLATLAQRRQEIAEGEMRAKSRFLSRMSHELRTPLNAVLGFAELLLAREVGDSAESALRVQQFEHIRGAGQHLLAMVNDVLELSCVEGGETKVERVAVSLAALLSETAALLEPVRRGAGVELQMGCVEGWVMADPRRLGQVLRNLLSNAIHCSRAGGVVRLDVGSRGGSTVVCISDDGRGMSSEQLQHLFEPFNRLGQSDGPLEGSGVGMAIAKALVEGMGGTLRADSREGCGSRFEVCLATASDAPAASDIFDTPEIPDPHPHPHPSASDPSTAEGFDHESGAARPAPRRVLYIEDNPVNALIIAELLARRSDLTLSVAIDGASGVADAQRLCPDLILLDMQLPDFDGFEVLRRLQADPRTNSIPCVALSANAMPEDIQRALAAGIVDYWTKPLDFKLFMAAFDGLFRAA